MQAYREDRVKLRYYKDEPNNLFLAADGCTDEAQHNANHLPKLDHSADQCAGDCQWHPVP